MSNLPKEIPLRKGTFSPDDLVAVFPAKILTALIRRDPECRRQFAAAIAAPTLNRGTAGRWIPRRVLASMIDFTGIAHAAQRSAESLCFELFRQGVGRAARFALVTSPAKSTRFGRRVLVKRAALRAISR
jgi:hypothetical protein